MQKVFDFLYTHAEPMGRSEFLSVFQSLISHYGFDHYRVFRRVVSHASVTDITLSEHLPDGWADLYRAKKYVEVDPVERAFCLMQVPFRWRDGIAFLSQATHRKRASELFQDAARSGLDEGYAFPIHGRNGLLGGVFISGRGCEFSAAELGTLDAAMRATFWRLAEFAGHMQELLARPNLSVAQLTRRERDVLNLLALGNTSPEIGHALSISSHTVDWYINGIQRKLDARNRQHVIALAFRCGLIA